MAFSSENLTSFIGIGENELCSALLHVKWRKLIELFSSHKGNCFWVNGFFSGRDADKLKDTNKFPTGEKHAAIHRNELIANNLYGILTVLKTFMCVTCLVMVLLCNLTISLDDLMLRHLFCCTTNHKSNWSGGPLAFAWFLSTHNRWRQDICMKATQTNMEDSELDTLWNNAKQRKDRSRQNKEQVPKTGASSGTCIDYMTFFNSYWRR